MQIIHKKKRSGKIRTIYAVSQEESRKYRDLLSKIVQPESALKAAHGFMPGRSIVTNAIPHINKKITINMDLTDFFDSVRPVQLLGKIPNVCIEECFLDPKGNPDKYDGAPRQGLPTSPAIANIAAIPMDKAIMKKLTKLDLPGVVYTRYADDLSISYDNDSQEVAKTVISFIKDIVRRCGFSVNTHKTRIVRNKSRREVCGVMVDDDIYISRRQRRKLRAAKHNLEMAIKDGKNAKILQSLMFKVKGLSEFAKLKKPVKKKIVKDVSEKQRIVEARILARDNGLRPPIKVNKIIPEQDLGSGVKITNDPAMFFGMSAYTTGWTSCMAINRGRNYKRGLSFWQRYPGVSLAYIDSGEKLSISGVTRPKMKARCLIYAFEDGMYRYDHIYDGHGHCRYFPNDHLLAQKLFDHGFSPFRTEDFSGRYGFETSHKKYVIGSVNINCPLPYFDTIGARKVHYKDGKSCWRLYI